MSCPKTGHRPVPPNRSPGHNEPVTCSRFPASVPVGGDDPVGTTPLVPCQPGRPIRVLVADDDARVRAAIAQVVALEADLALVAGVADAPAALALAEAADPAVALVDVLLPDATTGLALVAALGQRPGCAVVAMSVRSDLRLAALAAGAVAFAEKAGGIDAILDAIRAAASLHRALTFPPGRARHRPAPFLADTAGGRGPAFSDGAWVIAAGPPSRLTRSRSGPGGRCARGPERHTAQPNSFGRNQARSGGLND